MVRVTKTVNCVPGIYIYVVAHGGNCSVYSLDLLYVESIMRSVMIWCYMNKNLIESIIQKGFLLICGQLFLEL